MTGKRFTLAYANYDWWAICDKENPTERGISDEEVVELLNKLHEENKRLRSRNGKRLKRLKNQRKQLLKQQEAIWGYKGDIKELKKENKHLRKELSSFKPCTFQDMRTGTVILYWKEEVKK